MRVSVVTYVNCKQALEASLAALKAAAPKSVEYDIYRNATITRVLIERIDAQPTP